MVTNDVAPYKAVTLLLRSQASARRTVGAGLHEQTGCLICTWETLTIAYCSSTYLLITSLRLLIANSAQFESSAV